MRAAGIWFTVAALLMLARAVVEFSEPQYWDPVTPLDWAAVWLASTMMWALAVGLLLWWRHTPIRRGAPFLLIAALGALANGAGNALEDAFGNRDFGADLWVYGGGALFLGLVLAGVLALTVSHRLRWSGLLNLLFVVGFVLIEVAGFIFFLSPGALLVAAYFLIRGRGLDSG